MCRTFQALARRAAVDGLVQRSICGLLTEEMTERHSSVAQVEVEAALGKVISLAGYRDLLGGAPAGARSGGSSGSGGKVAGNGVMLPAGQERESCNRPRLLSLFERDTGFEPATFSLGS